MKKLLLVMGLMALVGTIKAEDMRLRGMGSVGVKAGQTTNEINMRVYSSDSDGNYISVTVTAMPKTASSSQLTVLSTTAQTLNLTSTVGVDGPCIICISNYDGTAPGVQVAFDTSTSAPSCMDGINAPCGDYVALDASGPCWLRNSGDHVHLIGKSTGSAEVHYDIQAIER